MLMPGPPPVPVEKKRRLGNPGKQKLPDVASVVPLRSIDADVPDHLGPAGSAFWQSATREGTHWIAPTDHHVLLLAAEALDRRAELVARLEADGPVLFTDKGYAYAHPAVGMVNTVEAQLTKWLSLLGFSPSDRSRLGLAEVKAQTKLEELRARRDERSS